MASYTNHIPLSEYFNNLPASEKLRYQEKVKECGFDPYCVKISEFKEDFEALPCIEYPDIVNYLVLQTSWLSNSQMKAYKSLEAYNFFISGWVSSLLTKEASDGRVVVFARVSYNNLIVQTKTKLRLSHSSAFFVNTLSDFVLHSG